MTEKELHRLKRQELLQLMLAQGRQAQALSIELKETAEQLEQMTANYERLRKRLDYKDIQIHRLRETLEAERTKRRIELVEAGSIAEASLRLNGIFEAAQTAADQYLYNIRQLQEKEVVADRRRKKLEHRAGTLKSFGHSLHGTGNRSAKGSRKLIRSRMQKGLRAGRQPDTEKSKSDGGY